MAALIVPSEENPSIRLALIGDHSIKLRNFVYSTGSSALERIAEIAGSLTRSAYSSTELRTALVNIKESIDAKEEMNAAKLFSSLRGEDSSIKAAEMAANKLRKELEITTEELKFLALCKEGTSE